jgi:hypothetical protein
VVSVAQPHSHNLKYKVTLLGFTVLERNWLAKWQDPDGILYLYLRISASALLIHLSLNLVIICPDFGFTLAYATETAVDGDTLSIHLNESF